MAPETSAMSTDATSTPSDTPQSWPVLSLNERRVLGVLIEKAKTTPDAYPLSLNALTTGCNQKSNRDPVMDLNDLDVEETLAACQKQLLVFKITGGRVDRWKHNVYEAWRLNKVEISIIGELLLRGAQTEGELRARASRMEPIADLDALRAALKPLAQRGLVVYLTPEGRRGTTLTHGFCAPKELEKLRAAHHGATDDEEPAAPRHAEPVREAPRAAAPTGEVDALRAELAALRTQVAELQKTVADLTAQLNSLRAALGA
jgi:uncharacterized protein YceH (UPF0502 family)